ncbi:MAG: lytic transglycosylase domain-containing protein [Spirochaetota bacterium]
MRVPFPPRSSRFLLLVVFCFSALGFSSCDGAFLGGNGGPFGLERRAFADIIARGDKGAIVALSSTALETPGSAGSSAWFFTALWLEKGGFAGSPEEVAAYNKRLKELYGLASAKAKGFVRDEAFSRLLALVENEIAAPRQGDDVEGKVWEAALDLAAPEGRDNEDLGLLRLRALAALDRHTQLFLEIADYARRFPDSKAQAEGALLYYESLARKRLGRDDWTVTLGLLLTIPTGTWVSKGIDLALEPGEEPAIPLDSVIFATARLRHEIELRDYGKAWHYYREAEPALRAETADRELVASFAKAFLYSGMSAEGLGLMDSLGAAKGVESPSASNAWVAAYYKGRMLKVLGRQAEAARLFKTLAKSAGDPVDRDSALWYALDSDWQALDAAAAPEKNWSSPRARNRALAESKLALLVGASETWTEASTFNDLVEPFFRLAVMNGDWELTESFALALSGRLGRGLSARSLYLAGRARELGLIVPSARIPLAPAGVDPAGLERGPGRPSDGILASARFASVTAMPNASDYYRLVASARLDRDLSPLPQAASVPARILPREGPKNEEQDLRASLEGLLGFGLASVAWTLASEHLELLDDGDLHELATAYAGSGRPTDSMLFINALDERGAKLTKRDVELLFPRPWLPEIRSSLGDSGIPEALVLGLLRSESWFRPDIQSRAGAVGLAQLMPATAADIAKKLRLTSYDLTNPADNIRLGMKMFRDLLVENEGRVLPALFAYNAGRGRLKRWLAESDGLPDDLFLESLSYEETRQYGRNIVTAGAWYASLYYGRPTSRTVREMIAGVPGIK